MKKLEKSSSCKFSPISWICIRLSSPAKIHHIKVQTYLLRMKFHVTRQWPRTQSMMRPPSSDRARTRPRRCAHQFQRPTIARRHLSEAAAAAAAAAAAVAAAAPTGTAPAATTAAGGVWSCALSARRCSSTSHEQRLEVLAETLSAALVYDENTTARTKSSSRTPQTTTSTSSTTRPRTTPATLAASRSSATPATRTAPP